MQTALRKLGNSTGLIVPRAMLDAMGLATGTKMDLAIEDGRLVASPVADGPRAGWAAAAAGLTDDDDAAEWLHVGNAGDEDLTW